MWAGQLGGGRHELENVTKMSEIAAGGLVRSCGSLGDIEDLRYQAGRQKEALAADSGGSDE